MFEEYALQNSCSLACDDTKPLVYDGYDDEYNVFSSPTFEEKTSYDYNMPPIFDDYGDENNYSWCPSLKVLILREGKRMRPTLRSP
jgi:hypothetical protein